MTKKQKRNLIRILLASAMLVVLSLLPVKGIGRLFLYLIPYFVVGYDILQKAVRGIYHRQAFDEALLMSVATIGALALAVYDGLHGGEANYTEAIAVMLFYQIGEWFQSYAVGKSRRNISALMDIRPDYANVERADGTLFRVDPDEVEVGDTIIIQPGEKIPIDGVVKVGASTLNTAALTGESAPREVAPGDEVISGCVNLNGVLRVETTKRFEESTASKILELMEEASSRKSHSENFIAKFARIYTPIVVVSAVALAILPGFVRLLLGESPHWGTWIYRALTFLVISCPCALVISIPLSFFAGIGAASRIGVLVKGSVYLETLSKARTMVFDKTGTLTKGVFKVTAIHPDEMKERELLHLAAHVERYSRHPIAESLRAAYPEEKDNCTVEEVEEIAGRGVRALVNGKTICVGNAKFMEEIGAGYKNCHHAGTILHVAIEGRYAGHIVISDVVKDHAVSALQSLKNCGIDRMVMLTGDSEAVASQVARELGIKEFHADLLPADKVLQVEALMDETEGRNRKLAFVGDGINDAPVLSRADIGIAMGAMGSDAAVEAADVVLMDDDPNRISMAIRLSRRCLRIVKENILLAIGIKLACLFLGAIGIANMWFAIFADVGVMIIAVLNAIRCLVVRKQEP
ncbi:MAG: cadmium-translocating P-type ATPase [Lachnospiraceae bacterium]|nr:cadmium-translocating P-type ATPase [Lachnospiraceae bacterium]